MGPRTRGTHDLTELLASGTNYLHYPSLLVFDARSNIAWATAPAVLQFSESLDNMENVCIGVKMERPNHFYGSKDQDVDTWLFQVCEHLDITVIPKRGQLPYAASLFPYNAALWWHEICEDNNRPGN